MDAFLSVVCVAFLVLAVITVVGHALWVAIAAIGRAFFGTPTDHRDGPARRRRAALDCPRCDVRLPLGETDCPRCGMNCEDAAAGELNDLEATARHLERFRKGGLLPVAILEQVWDLVQQRHARHRRRPQRSRHSRSRRKPRRPGKHGRRHERCRPERSWRTSRSSFRSSRGRT
jgi:hypothetical protein